MRDAGDVYVRFDAEAEVEEVAARAVLRRLAVLRRWRPADLGVKVSSGVRKKGEDEDGRTAALIKPGTLTLKSGSAGAADPFAFVLGLDVVSRFKRPGTATWIPPFPMSA